MMMVVVVDDDVDCRSGPRDSPPPPRRYSATAPPLGPPWRDPKALVRHNPGGRRSNKLSSPPPVPFPEVFRKALPFASGSRGVGCGCGCVSGEILLRLLVGGGKKCSSFYSPQRIGGWDRELPFACFKVPRRAPNSDGKSIFQRWNLRSSSIPQGNAHTGLPPDPVASFTRRASGVTPVVV